MAAPTQDPRCCYSFFALKPEGKVPCLAIGTQVDDGLVQNDEEIVGITFQPAAAGRVKPVLPIDSFTELNWANAPTKDNNDELPMYINLEEEALQPPDIPPKWEEFVRTMKAAKEAMLDLMTPDGEERPELLLTAFQMFTTMYPSLRPFPVTLGDVVRRADAANWTANSDILKWVKSVVQGCCGPSHELVNCFEVLFPALKPTNRTVTAEHSYLQVPPSEPSTNDTLLMGVPHCLAYGFDSSQFKLRQVLTSKPVLKRQLQNFQEREGDDDMDAQEDAARVGRRSRPRHRVLHPKKQKDRSRSRSLSPASDEEVDLVDNVTCVGQNMPTPITLSHMLNNPDDYMLSTHKYFKFFQSHKPDLMCLKSIPQQHGQSSLIVAKFVVEISSWNRQGMEPVTIERQVEEVTERCVRSCLAALACNQNSIMGICVVVDGLKLIQIEKVKDGNISYNIEETNLVQWDEVDDMYVLLEMIKNAIIT